MTAEPKWTPGPWRVNEQNVVVPVNDKLHGIPVEFGWIEQAWRGNDATEESVANSNLIAAAPDLYRALVLVTCTALQLGATDMEVGVAEKALAKARGEHLKPEDV